jgi:glutathione S-transferase
VGIVLYGFDISPPTQAVRAMFDYKGIERHDSDLLPGMHPMLLRLLGFRGGTVPAMKVNGRRVQTSIAIARELERMQPEPPLYPADRREAVEQAEAWADRDLQDIPRRIFRWVVKNRHDIREWMAREVVGMPAPSAMATINKPVAVAMARVSNAYDDTAAAAFGSLPGLLDHADSLIASGTIGAEQPTAADFQIGAVVRGLYAWQDLQPMLSGRACADLALRLFPSWVADAPPMLPREWLSPN